ncbi:MAG TPA: hypothetical protein VLH61_00430 [Bacteroidales bacterium]|nr:hypothetical protein [Bacteroidales bacterium]
MAELRILGILVSQRSKAAVSVQQILTKYGGCIKTRLGLHELDKPDCEDCGLIILELSCDEEECNRLENELLEVSGVKLQKMVF